MKSISHEEMGISLRLWQEIRELARKRGIGKVIVFGSRARGDFRGKSDIDLAVSGGDGRAFSLDVEDMTWTLLSFDVVCLDRPVETALLKSIEKEGRVLYEKYENFIKALHNLGVIHQYEPPYDVATLTGLVALYQICFEQAWKAMKEQLQEEGYDEGKTGSPRQVLKTAWAAGVIADEEGWLAALADRNETAHAYNEAVALSIIDAARNCYYDLFCQLQQELKRRKE